MPAIFIFSSAAVRKKFQGEAQVGGQKGRWSGGRNFCPPALPGRCAGWGGSKSQNRDFRQKKFGF